MKVPENWLRQYCSPEWSSEELAERLTMGGLEVEESESFAPAFSGVVVGHVKSVVPHPDADKLRVCEVDTGTETVSIVCGASNVADGVKVPCALSGAQLPGGFKIKPVKMRGVQSNGMLCSARELGISEDHEGLLILADDAPVGHDIRDYLGLDEQVMTLKLTPNLSHCLGVYGVARELSALSGAALTGPAFDPVTPTIEDRLPVTIEAPDLCGRFSGRVIRGVNPLARTPQWMCDRLERAGQRSISPLVDISNYVMLELSRPTHVFDLNKVSGSLTVRWGRDDESLKLLNGQTLKLSPTYGVIADSRAVESLAGIMGGDDTAVDDNTRDIYLEAAFWWPEAIAGRTRMLNFSTDAAHRFERGVDAATTVEHIEYVTRLILDICGGQPGPVDDTVATLPDRPPVTLRFERARQVIGQPVSDDDIFGALTSLGLPCERQQAQVVVQPPSYRFDMAIEEDLIEEVARMYGYDRLPLRPPVAGLAMQAAVESRRTALQVKLAVAARGYQEMIAYSFVPGEMDKRLSGEQAIALLNPIAKPMDVMRTTLWGGMLNTLQANLNRRASRVRLFEVGRVFLRDPAVISGDLSVAGIAQPNKLALLASGGAQPEQWNGDNRPVDFFDVKQDLASLMPAAQLEFVAAAQPALHPGRSAQVSVNGKPIGWIGELHPMLQASLDLPGRVIIAEVDLDVLLERQVPVFSEVSRFPPSIRDIAIVVDASLPADSVYREIRSIVNSERKASVVQNIRLFDEYRGKGLENKEKSLAFRLWMQDIQRTLEDEEVSAAVECIVAGLAARFNARLR
ncbi:MAG: phenylalanine--tRNA ligase subunit beta [Burkholderiaceae bacterium]